MTHKLIDLGQGRFQYRSYSFEIKPALRRPAERIWNLSIPHCWLAPGKICLDFSST
jgi:hypothetical protein